MTKHINPAALRGIVTDGQEFALLDVRERGHFAAGHLYLAVNTTLSSFELVMRARVPRLSTRVVLCDDNEGLAHRAAAIMARAGYTNLLVFDGPVQECEKVGFQIFQGHYVTTYALGLHISLLAETPEISPRVLKEKLEAGDNVAVLYSDTIGSYAAE